MNKLFLINCSISLDFLQIPSSIPSVKIPKFKKIRQWSHDSLANLSQLTNRAVGTLNASDKPHKSPNEILTTGISTISAAINDHQQIDPKKDNFGLYALKCDRSKTLANAKRGILLTLPTPSSSKLKSSASFQTIEQNHEIFKSCENIDDESVENVYDNSRKLNSKASKIAPPPRKKKKPNIQLPPPPPKKSGSVQKINKAGQGVAIAFETVERNDSGLYKIVSAAETAKITFVEPKVAAKEMKSVTSFAKPRVEKAVVVKSTSFEAKR